MCKSSDYSAKDKTIGVSRLPCRADEDGQTIEVMGLILRVGDRYGVPVMQPKDPYAPDPRPKSKPKFKPKLSTCGGFVKSEPPGPVTEPSGSEE